MSQSNFNKVLGGPTWQVVIRLLTLSLIVGAVLSYIGLHPLELFDAFIEFFEGLWLRGWDALGLVGRYIGLGAMVVVPIWLVSRILSSKSQ